MRVLLLIAALGFATQAWAESELRKIDWPESLPSGVAHNADGSITITSSSGDGLTVTLASLEAPGITKSRYAVKGRVRYDDVVGQGYLEMWNVFGDGRYFTRTIEDRGPMRALTGSTDWRSIVLPFDAAGSGKVPERLTINAVLPGTGVVTLEPLVLVELEAGEWPSGVNDSARGVWGGVVGAALGILAGVLGWLGGMGKAKRLVLNGFRMLMAAGGALLTVGVIALAQGSPYSVYYPMLLVGAIALLVPASTLPRLAKRYEEIELRRMSALDA